MVQSNKILTVSYGTFSCTLEGFDNPFGAMQSIAEYFRDLAAEDRYFGAEPPQPDAQMLHQIAEREVRRRVEARVGESGVVLRQVAEDDGTKGHPSPPQAAGSPPAAPEQEVADPPARQPLAEAASQAPDSETVADRLARIRAVVAKARAERDRTYEEDEQVVDDEDDSLLTAFALAEDAELSDADDFGDEESGEDDSEPMLTSSDALKTRAANSAAQADPEDEGAVSADAPDGSVEGDEASELSLISAAHQVGADTGIPVVATGLGIAAADRAEADPAVPAHSPEEAAADSTGAQDDGAEAAAQDDTPDPASEGGLPAGMPSREQPTAEGDLDLTRLEMAIAAAETTSAPQAEDAGGEIPATDVEAEAEPQSRFAEDAAFKDAVGGPSPSTEDEWVEVEVEGDDGVPHVVRMSRAEFDDALAKGELEEIEDDGGHDDAEDSIRDILAGANLSSQDVSELAAELATVEAEAGMRDIGADAPAKDATQATPEAGAERQPDATGRASSQLDETGDGTISRLIDETNVHLGEPEAHRRRTAIQHLRGAVAATKADDGLRKRGSDGASMDKFRDDLNEAVRPRRPDSSARATRPLAPLEGGPLVLVSSQRVDTRIEPVRPVRPSRPKPTAVEIEPRETQDDAKETFAEFAAKLGARELPDLLEAAAAYSKIVEGQDGTPRPVMIRRATEVAGGGESLREEGLKSFGQLLRSGRIRKVEAGRFALAQDAEIAQKARAAN